MLKKQTNIVIFIHHVNILRMEDGRTLLQWTDAETESEELCCSSQDIACITHRPGPWFRHWVVVCVPLLCLPVDLSVAPTEGSFHLCHGEGAHRWAARCPFIPARTSKGILHISFAMWKDLVSHLHPSPCSVLPNPSFWQLSHWRTVVEQALE